MSNAPHETGKQSARRLLHFLWRELFCRLREAWRGLCPAACQWLDLRRTVFLADSFYRRSIILALAGAALAIWGRFASHSSWEIQVMGAMLAAGSILAAARKMNHLRVSTRERIALARSFTSVDIANERIPFSELASSPSGRKAGFKIVCEPEWSPESFERSAAFDDGLVLAESIPFTETDSEKGSFFADEAAVGDDLRTRQLRYLITRVESEAPRHNDDKFGLRMSLTIPIGPVTVQRTGYYDGLITNEAARSEVFTQDRGLHDDHADRRKVFDLFDSFPLSRYDGAPCLSDFPALRIANHVGVTTLALSSDHRLLLFRQSYQEAIGAKSIVASGSGSVNYSDLWRSRPSRDLLKVLRYAMARELCEEANERAKAGLVSLWQGARLPARIAAAQQRTMVTGFFRWVDRSGKPEFIGVTRLNAPHENIMPDGKEVRSLNIRWPIVHRMRDFHHAREEIAGCMARIGQPLNLSLHVSLTRICEIARYADSRDPMRRAIYEKTAAVLGLPD